MLFVMVILSLFIKTFKNVMIYTSIFTTIVVLSVGATFNPPDTVDTKDYLISFIVIFAIGAYLLVFF